VYDGEELCNVHLTYVKAREPCSICLEPMTDRDSRCKLGCGHFFHSECIGKCVDPECPLCRQQISASQASKLFYSSKIEPLSQRLFSLSSKQISAVLSSLEKVVAVAERPGSEEWEIDYLDGMVESFAYGLGVCDVVCEVVDAVPQDIMGDACKTFTSSLMHLNKYRSLSGFEVEGCYDTLHVSSVSPTDFQQLYTDAAYVPAAVPQYEQPIHNESSDDLLLFGDQNEGAGGQLLAPMVLHV
jgi:hypothetical protein